MEKIDTSRWEFGRYIAQWTVIWGIVAVWPTFDLFKTAPSYSEYARYAPDYVWGIVAILLGLLKLVGIWTGDGRILFPSSLLLSGYFVFGALCFLKANSPSAGGPLFALNVAWQIRQYIIVAKETPNTVIATRRLWSKISKKGK